MRRRWAVVAILAALVGAGAGALRGCRLAAKRAPSPAPMSTPVVAVVPPPAEKPQPAPIAAPRKVKKARRERKKVAAKPAGAPVRPEVTLHPELIPKNIHIVRVYYASSIAGPGETIEFDINGSGFTSEFQKQLTVHSGMPKVDVKDFSLVTPNQIHGRLVVAPDAATKFAFPTVSIGDKVVFQAAEPFAVIRPGEVLNFVFIEMGESGRSGRFRVFTNLSAEMIPRFRVEPSTPAIALGNLEPHLPFVMDGTISIGPALTGEYGVKVLLGDKVLWERPTIIRIVKPNVGQTGLVLRIQPEDGFHRPGDVARFQVQGSGFQPTDAAALSAEVAGMKGVTSSFTYVAAGRMALDITLPKTAKTGAYKISITNGGNVLFETPDALRVVPSNWVRSIAASPPLRPGGKSEIVLQGRALEKKFIEALHVAVDEPGLKIGAFRRLSATRAVAPVSATSSVRPGDYQVRIRHLRRRVVPHAGDIIRIVPAE